jgi:eukaryotic-like serine/threonine-protein kinase
MSLTLVSHYRLAEKIGSGGLGEVYRAYDTQSGRQVAIKILPAYLASEPTVLKRFEREAKLISSVSHPNVVSIYEVGEFEGAPYLVTEYVEGETLRRKTASGPLPIDKVIQTAFQLGRGLAALHERHILHRDLNPSNILVTPIGRVKILDLGLPAKRSSPFTEPTETSPGLVFGTVAYMAPELYAESTDPRSDIFSYGAILYKMATGRPPWSEKEMQSRRTALTESIMHEQPVSPSVLNPKVPPFLEFIILKCLRQKPEERYQTIREVLEELVRFERGGGPFSARFSTGAHLPVAGISTASANSALVVALSGTFADALRVRLALMRLKNLVVALSGTFADAFLDSIANVRDWEFRKTFAASMLGLTCVLVLVGLIPLAGTVLGFGLAFGGSLLGYECYLLLKVSK